jgi:hypothetical protein
MATEGGYVMKAARRLVKLLVVCCLCTVGSRADPTGEPGLVADAGVTMEITELDVNDVALSLTYNITNGTDRETWVCSTIGRRPFEVFPSDEQTLLIRIRLDIPSTAEWGRGGPAGTYVRILPRASRAESLQIALPASPVVVYGSRYATEPAQPLRRLALEIGYYDEDLPALIHSIIDVAEKSGLTVWDVPSNILNTYFRGVVVRGALASFDVVNRDPYGRGCATIAYNYQALTGEKVLRVDVNDVAIPYAAR